MVYTAKWGIVATGWICEQFVKDAVLDPATRGVSDVNHKIVAVASRSVEKARKFISDYIPYASEVKSYGDYDALFADPGIDIVYIGTPHHQHYPVALKALRAGKNVVCEKPLTINGSQAAHLAQVAKQQKCFLMEAMWTRFFPLTHKVQELVFKDKIIGDISRVHSDLSFSFTPEANARLFNPAYGGGALLDIGVYAITWILMLCYEHPDNALTPPTSTKSLILPTRSTGVDEETTIIQTWEKPHIMSIASMSMNFESSKDFAVRIEGSKGQIVVPASSCRPEEVWVRVDGKPEQILKFPLPGHGMFYEADQVARDVRDGRLESSVYPLNLSLVSMSLCDEIRKQNSFAYSAEIEATE
ncbi:uncharacterized protein V1516DRAFT_413720 [Lipomyces oligophaga]|uniref:uncharacterized protein n=1 Tax=Lipomyces oligophaga TaxID=45792 RepID=UPI0034CFFE7F